MLDGCVPWPEELASHYREAGYWQGETLGALLRQWATKYGDRQALVSQDGQQRLTYRALDTWCDRLAAGFAARGIAAGERVLVQLPNSPEFVAVCFALFRLGALPVFALPVYRDNEIGHLARLSGARALVVPDTFNGYDHRDLARRVRDGLPDLEQVFVAGEPGASDGFTALADVDAEPLDLPDPDPGDVAFFLLSGGTTALPKLIPRTHDGYVHQVRVTGEICEADGDTVYLAVLPAEFNFPWGCPGIVGTLHAGGRVVFAQTPHPLTCFPLIARENVTLTSLSPTLVHLWMEAVEDEDGHGHDLSSLRTVQVGSAKLHDEVAARIEPVLGVRLQQVFGMAEGLLTFTRYDDPAQTVLTTQGRPVSPGDEVRIVDGDDNELPDGHVGELLTRGPYTLRGYYRAPEHNAVAFTEDGFYRSGDLACRTPTGEIVIKGRIKDVVVRGGDKVSATEVEGHLATHPDVQQAAVVAMPDRVLGEKICAYVVASPGRTAPGLAPLRALLRARGLAAYKLPDRVEHLDAFPLTGLNKVDKNALRARIADTLDPLALAEA